MTDLFELISRLSEAGVSFILIGGFASCVQGATHLTQDVDICCEFDKENLLKLQSVLAKLKPVHRMTPQKLPCEINEKNWNTFKNLYIDTELGQIDCLSYVDGLGEYKEVEKYTDVLEVDGKEIKVLSIDGLIKAKRALARDKDIIALRELEYIKNAKLDKE